MLMFTFFHLLFDHFQFTLTWTYLSRFLCNLYSIELYFHLQSHTQLGVVFWFGSASSVFLELLVHSSLVAYWAPNNLGCSSFRVIVFLPFDTFHGLLETRILKGFAIPFSSGPHFVKTLHHDLSVLGGPTWHGSWFHWVRQGYGPYDQIG